MGLEATEPFALGDWLVEPSLNRISCASQDLRLRPQVMELLVYLANRQGKVATLESIHDDLWVGKVVSSGTIYNCIAELRQAFATSGAGLEYLETLPKKGYRIAPYILTRPAMSDSGQAVTIAIMPLANRAVPPELEYLCAGIADEILFCLSSVEGLRVCSAAGLKDTSIDPRVIGMRHQAKFVLGGSLQAHGQRLRVMLRLESVADGRVLWVGRYDPAVEDIFDLQPSVARQVVDAVASAVGNPLVSDTALDESGTRNLHALQAFLLGRHAMSHMTFASHRDAIAHFERAVSLDPSFGRAHYRLYLAHYLRCKYFGADRGEIEKARTAARSAQQQGYKPAVPWVHVHRRLHPLARLSSRELALEALDKLRNPDPEWGSFALEQLTWTLSDAGLFEEALALARKVLTSPDHNFQDSDVDEELPGYTAACGQIEEAIGLWSNLIQKEPARPMFRCERAILQARTGHFRYAEMDIAALNHPAYLITGQAFLAFFNDRAQQVRELHQQLLDVRGIHPTLTLCTAALTGDLDEALQHYECAVNETSRGFVDFGPTRVMTRARLPADLVREIEAHPRFAVLLDSQGIDEAWRVELQRRVREVPGLAAGGDIGDQPPLA